MATASETYAKEQNKRRWERRWENVVNTAKVIVVVSLAVGAAWLVVAGLVYAISKPECEARTAQIGFPSRWSFWGDCQMETAEGKWIPLSNYYYVEHP